MTKFKQRISKLNEEICEWLTENQQKSRLMKASIQLYVAAPTTGLVEFLIIYTTSETSGFVKIGHDVISLALIRICAAKMIL